VPEAAGYFCSSSSWACCDSVPGTENLSLVLPPKAAALATTAISTVAQMATTRQRCSKAQPPSR
jgi:hypothetical protein